MLDMLEMPKEMKAKWLEALRSGKYKQGSRSLKTANGEYCCLGVLQCVVSGDVEYANFAAKPVALGMPTREWYEANNLNWMVTPHREHDTVNKLSMFLNDGEPDGEYGEYGEGRVEHSFYYEEYEEPRDFLYIADYIEANITGI